MIDYQPFPFQHNVETGTAEAFPLAGYFSESLA